MSVTSNTLTRRNFVTGAAIATGAAATAGLASAALGEEAASGIDAAAAAQEADGTSGGADWLGSAPEIAEDQIASIEDVDVLVVGAGGAGLMCAAICGELGMKALVLEKTDTTGSFRTDIASFGSRQQVELGIEVDKGAIIHEIQKYSCGAANARLWKVWADESGQAIDWMLDLLDEGGVPYFFESDPGLEDMIYPEWPVTNGFSDAETGMQTLLARLESVGAQVRYQTPMVKLEREEGGRVTGAIAQDLNTGEYLRVNASKGVVIATGGYATNDEMLKALVPGPVHQCTMKERTPSQDGDGIKAALWVGANMDEDGTIMAFERGCVPFGPEYDGPSEDAQIWWPGSQPFLRVTLQGERFSNESVPYDFSMYAARTLHQNTWVQIFDANWKDQIAQFKTVGCSRIVDPGTMPGWSPTMPMEAIESMLQAYTEGGLIVQADTIEELAEKIGCDPAVLGATVERYNELCEAGYDEDFYKEPERMAALTTPPFYAARIGGMLLATISGLTVNENMQVMDTEGNVIEGLYANGNDCGSCYLHTYPSRIAGLHMGRNTTFAWHIAHYLAGQEA